ncbi:hypothetical protein [[Phormidium] sp. ETS-05]|nr:hypothetical protein [[Phormidium] sp. ETS-05]
MPNAKALTIRHSPYLVEGFGVRALYQIDGQTAVYPRGQSLTLVSA